MPVSRAGHLGVRGPRRSHRFGSSSALQGWAPDRGTPSLREWPRGPRVCLSRPHTPTPCRWQKQVRGAGGREVPPVRAALAL